MFFQSCWWKWKETSTSDFFKLSKKNLPNGCFHKMFLYASAANVFRVRTKGVKQQHYEKLKQIIYFNIINIDECWCKIGFASEGSFINQSWSTQFPVVIISQMALLHGQLAMSLRRVKRSIICKCQCFCLFDIQGQFYFKYYFLRHRNPPSKRSS